METGQTLFDYKASVITLLICIMYLFIHLEGTAIWYFINLFSIWLDFIEILEVDLYHLESFMDHTE